jgi:DNA invertase Pin-like site-specific DNA recombinase
MMPARDLIPAAAWFRVSTGHQEADNQVPDVDLFAGHHGYEIGLRYEVTDTAWKNGGGREYQRALRQALADAHAGRFKVLIVWALDRIVRDEEGGAEAALRIMRQFRQAGVMVVSVKEPWLNGSREVQDVLVAFAGWMAERESARRSERIRNGLERRRAEGLPVGRQPGAADKKRRKRAGYVASWEGGKRRAAQQARVGETQGVTS